MAYELTVYIVDPGDKTIKVAHTFFGTTEAEAETYHREHAAHCEYFRAAEQAGRTFEELEEVDDDELPSPEDFDEDDTEEYEVG